MPKTKTIRSFNSTDEMELYYKLKMELATTEKERRDAKAQLEVTRYLTRLFSNSYSTAIHRDGGPLIAK